jgi:DNA translocase FtsK/SpoIIIE-like protein
MGGNGDLIGIGLVAGTGTLLFGGAVAYFTADNLGIPGWVGPAGLVGTVGLGAAAVIGAKVSGRRQRERTAAHAAMVAAQDWERLMNDFAPRVRSALWRLSDPWQACLLWTGPKLNMGRQPDPYAGDPGAWPVVLPWLNPPAGTDPDPGMWPLPVGARVRLQLPDGWSARDLSARLDNLASSLDVPKVRIIAEDGAQVVIDLRVFDPLGDILMSPLVREEIGPDGARRYRSAVPIGSLSCMDDITLGISEFGTPQTVNFAKGVHRALQGATRSGKSVTLYTLILSSLLMRDTVTVVIDPNGATVAPFWQVADFVCDSQNPKDATALLDVVIEAMYERKKLFTELRTDRITDFSPELPLWNVFIDENSNFEGDKKYAEKLKIAAKQLAKFGGRITIADQKLSAEALSTAIRINLFDRISHRVESRQDFDHLFPGLPDMAEEAANPHNPMAQGVGIARLMAHPEPTRMRVFYLPSEACWDIGDQIVAERGALRPAMGDEDDDDSAGAFRDSSAGTPAPRPAPRRAKVLDFPAASAETGDDATGRCLYCGDPLTQKSGGRARKYCSDAHKIAYFRDRKAQGD